MSQPPSYPPPGPPTGPPPGPTGWANAPAPGGPPPPPNAYGSPAPGAGQMPLGGWPGLKPDGSTKGPNLGLSLGVLGVGLLTGIVALAFIVVAFIDLVDNETFRLPGDITLDLEEGEWIVFGNTDGAFFTPSDIEVDGPARVDIGRADFDESRTIGSDEYQAVAELDIDEAGEYTISIDTFGQRGEAMVGRSFTALESAVVWLGLGALGGLVFVIGLILTIIAMVNRGRAKRSRAQLGLSS